MRQQTGFFPIRAWLHPGLRAIADATVFSFASFNPLFLTKNLKFQIHDLKCFFMRPSEAK